MEEELTISMMVWESRLGGGPHDTGRQLGVSPDQPPAAPHALKVARQLGAASSGPRGAGHVLRAGRAAREVRVCERVRYEVCGGRGADRAGSSSEAHTPFTV